MTALLAATGSPDFMHGLFWVIGVGLCAWLIWWLLDYIKLPEPFNKVARVLLAVAVVVFLIRIILSITGSPP